MDYRYLGKTGLNVSELCLGTMTFGREANEPDSHAMLDRFVEAGGNFIDTADVYTRGVSEEFIGNWLKNKTRSEVILATKVRFTMGDDVNNTGLSRSHILDAVDKSLQRLQTDYIDLYQVHCWDRGTPLEETLSTLDGLVKAGKVRYIGVSNYTAWQLQKAVDISRQNGWEVFTCLQPLYNLLDRYIEWGLVEVCANEGIGIIPWSPLRGGWLTGKYQRGMENPPEGSRIEIADEHGWSEGWSNYAHDRTWHVIDTLMDVANETGKEPAQVALNWCKDQPQVTAPIIGVRNMKQLDSNLGSVGWKLSEEQLQKLNEASHLKAPYPNDFIAEAQEGR